MAGVEFYRHSARRVDLRTLVGEGVALDHVIDRLGDIGRVIVHALDVLGAKQKMDAEGHGAGIYLPSCR